MAVVLKTTEPGRVPGVRIPLSPIFAMGPAVTIHIFGELRTYCAGRAQLLVSAPTVRAALEDLERNQPALYRNLCDETGAVRKHLNVFVNDDNVRDLSGVDTALSPGDVLTFLPAVSGG
jgi:molybdopterin synthase sulfur carrier subunit